MTSKIFKSGIATFLAAALVVSMFCNVIPKTFAATSDTTTSSQQSNASSSSADTSSSASSASSASSDSSTSGDSSAQSGESSTPNNSQSQSINKSEVLANKTAPLSDNSPVLGTIQQVFPDHVLSFVIAKQMGKSVTDTVTVRDLNNVYVLDGIPSKYGLSKNDKIVSLTGVENLHNLKGISVYDGNVTDLTPLQGLTNLEGVNIPSSPNLSNLCPLKNLHKLETLDCRACNISDLTPLQDLTSLSKLYLTRNPITNITPLHNLTKLSHLELYDCDVSDLTVLPGRSHAIFNLYGNRIINISKESYSKIKSDPWSNSSNSWGSFRNQHYEKTLSKEGSVNSDYTLDALPIFTQYPENEPGKNFAYELQTPSNIGGSKRLPISVDANNQLTIPKSYFTENGTPKGGKYILRANANGGVIDGSVYSLTFQVNCPAPTNDLTFHQAETGSYRTGSSRVEKIKTGSFATAVPSAGNPFGYTYAGWTTTVPNDLNKVYALANPTQANGYVAAGKEASIQSTKTQDYYAVYLPNTNTINFHEANTGSYVSGKVDTQQVATGAHAAKVTGTVNPIGYELAGWTTENHSADTTPYTDQHAPGFVASGAEDTISSDGTATVNYYAVYKQHGDNKVTFEDYQGNTYTVNETDTDLITGADLKLPTAHVPNGYNFAGWTSEKPNPLTTVGTTAVADIAYGSTATIKVPASGKAGVTYYVVYGRNTDNAVTFDDYQGNTYTKNETDTWLVTDADLKLPTAHVPNGYTFAGWTSTKPNPLTAVDTADRADIADSNATSIKVPASGRAGVTYYAVYQAKSDNAVVFRDYRGNDYDINHIYTRLTTGDDLKLPTANVPNGYTFAGWTSTKPHPLTAVDTTDRLDIADSNATSIKVPASGKYGVTYYAVYKQNGDNKVTFEDYQGKQYTNNETDTGLVAGANLKLPTAHVPNGYTFAGWTSTKPNPLTTVDTTDKTDIADSNVGTIKVPASGKAGVTYYAVYKGKSNNALAFYDYRSSSYSIAAKFLKYTTGEDIKLPFASEPVGYTFVGWTSTVPNPLTTVDTTDPTDIADSNTTTIKVPASAGKIGGINCYAVYKAKNDNVVTFMDYQGKQYTENETDSGLVIDADLKLPTAHVPNGYTFSGWTSAAPIPQNTVDTTDKADIADSNATSIKVPASGKYGVTYYAVYKKNANNTVTFEDYQGKQYTNNETDTGLVTGANLKLPTAHVPNGYTFAGWTSTKPNPLTAVDTTDKADIAAAYAISIKVPVSGKAGVTYYAVYKANRDNKVTFEDYQGNTYTVNETDTGLATGADLKLPTAHVPNGYNFAGWTSEKPNPLTTVGTTAVADIAYGSTATIKVPASGKAGVTYYVVYGRNTDNAVTFNDYQGKQYTKNETDTWLVTDADLKLPTAHVPNGYTFAGWTSTKPNPLTTVDTTDRADIADSNAKTIKVPASGRSGVTYYAVYQAKSDNVVVFKDYRGNDYDVNRKYTKLTTGDDLKLPNAHVPYGYTFAGWTSTKPKPLTGVDTTDKPDIADSRATTIKVPASGKTGVTYYAVYRQKANNTVTFEDYQGKKYTINETDRGLVKGANLKLPTANVPNGYDFAGWTSTKPNPLTTVDTTDKTDIADSNAKTIKVPASGKAGVTYYAVYQAKKHNVVTFSDYRGNDYDVNRKYTKLTTGDDLKLPTAHVPNGYDFAGWTSTKPNPLTTVDTTDKTDIADSNATTIKVPASGKAGVTYYAVYQAKKHNVVTFSDYRGNHYDTNSTLDHLTTGDNLKLPTAKVPNGYDFAGWTSTKPNPLTAVDTTDKTDIADSNATTIKVPASGKSGVTYYAVYQAKKHNVVTFSDYRGNDYDVNRKYTKLTTGDDLKLPTAHVPNGYDFAGWTSTKPNPLTAVDTTDKTDIADSNATTIKVPASGKSGVTYYAVYQAKKHNVVTFSDYRGNHYDTNSTKDHLTTGDNLKLPTAKVPNGYDFAGWTSTKPNPLTAVDTTDKTDIADSNATTIKVPASGKSGVTYYAVYQAKKHNVVTFSDYQGNHYDTNSTKDHLTTGDNLKLPTANVPNGYNFAGWTSTKPNPLTTIDITDKTDIADSNAKTIKVPASGKSGVTYYAVYKENSNNITFRQAEQGSYVTGTSTAQQVNTTEFATDVPSAGDPFGYTFAGWTTTVPNDLNNVYALADPTQATGYATAATSVQSTGVPTQDYYAVYLPNKNTINFHEADTGSYVNGTIQVERVLTGNYAVSVKGTVDPTGHTLVGWTTEDHSNDTTPYIDDTINSPGFVALGQENTIPSDGTDVINYYGVYTVNSYKLHLYNNGPTGSVTYTVNSKSGVVGDPIKYQSAVEVTATPADGYYFTGWTDVTGITAFHSTLGAPLGTIDLSGPVVGFAMPAQNVTLKANFAPNPMLSARTAAFDSTYTSGTPTASSKGKVNVVGSTDASWNDTFDKMQVKPDATATVQAQPQLGAQFSGWTPQDGAGNTIALAQLQVVDTGTQRAMTTADLTNPNLTIVMPKGNILAADPITGNMKLVMVASFTSNAPNPNPNPNPSPSPSPTPTNNTTNGGGLINNVNNTTLNSNKNPATGDDDLPFAACAVVCMLALGCVVIFSKKRYDLKD